MKNKIPVLFLLIAAVFCAVAWIQSRQNQALQREVAALRVRLEERNRERQADETLKRGLAAEQERLSLEVQQLTRELATARGATSTQGAPAPADTLPAVDSSPTENRKGAFGDMLSKMLEDPAMRKMMRQQQLAMMDTMYGPLFKQWRLSPEEIDQFKERLVDSQMGGMENAGALLGGGADPAGREEAMRAISEKHKAAEEQLKSLLGEERFAQYQDYQGTLGERMMLNQFQQQLAGGRNALNDDQNGQLFAILREERRNAPSVFGNDPNTPPDPARIQAMLSEEKMSQHFEQEEQLNRRVLERAAAVLNPEQIDTLKNFQASQLQMQRFGMSMALRFMGKKPEDPPKSGEK
jgi:hypothetical protein